MRGHIRKTSPRVIGGRAQRKNRWQRSPSYVHAPPPELVIDRPNPGPRYRHLLRKDDIRRFIRLLPNWEELSVGLRAIVLAPGECNCDGWYHSGIVAVCAWERELWRDVERAHWEEHRKVLDLLGVPYRSLGDGYVRCEWTLSSARAYQLTHILLHELGHHDDRMRTRSKRRCARGEPYAENYAIRYADRIWENYLCEFGLP